MLARRPRPLRNPRPYRPRDIEEAQLSLRAAGAIQDLLPGSPVLQALLELPLRAPCHTILGNLFAAEATSGGDGVVAYESGHLAEAESELVVRSNHLVPLQPETALEVARILREHLRR